MELTKKTTILFSPVLHARLVKLAEQRGTSLGDLVRAACEKTYALVSEEDRLASLRALSRLSLPIADVKTMKEQSVPTEGDLLQ